MTLPGPAAGARVEHVRIDVFQIAQSRPLVGTILFAVLVPGVMLVVGRVVVAREVLGWFLQLMCDVLEFVRRECETLGAENGAS